MKLIALTDIHTPEGVIKTKSEFDEKDKAEAQRLIDVGAAIRPAHLAELEELADASAKNTPIV